MTREQIIAMAREAGFVPHYTRPQDAIVRKGCALSGELKGYKAETLDVERFFHAAYAAGAAAEREACAKVCEQRGMVKGGEVFAARIRARGEK